METTSLIKKDQDWRLSIVVVLGGYQLVRQQGGYHGMVSSRSYLRGLALLEDPHEEVGRVPHGDPLPLRGFANHLSLRAAWPD